MKVRDLQKSYNFREAVKKWGEPQGRKKIFFASYPEKDDDAIESHLNLPIKDNLKIQNSQCENIKNIRHDGDITTSSLAENKLRDTCKEIQNVDKQIIQKCDEYEKLRLWIDERKTLRKQMQNMGLTKAWIENKSSKTESENHVYEKMKTGYEKNKKEKLNVIPKIYMRKPRLSEAHVEYLPFLNSPLPIALAMIADFLHDNRLRLVDLFKKIDKNKDWRMTREELKTSLKETSIPLTEAHLDELILAVDSNNDNQLSYKELARGIEAYHKDRRWQKLKNMYDNIIESDVSTNRQRRASIADRKAVVDVLLLPKFEDQQDREANKEKQRAIRNMERRERARTESKRNNRANIIPRFSSISGVTGQQKTNYLKFVNEECDRCNDRLLFEGVVADGGTLDRALIPPTDNTYEDCKMHFTSNLSAYPTSHITNLNYEKQRRRKLRKSQAGVILISNRDNESSLSEKERRMKITLPRVASLDLNDRAIEARAQRRHMRSASPTVFWPQHLLDKMRLCMDKNESIASSNVMFNYVRR